MRGTDTQQSNESIAQSIGQTLKNTLRLIFSEDRFIASGDKRERLFEAAKMELTTDVYYPLVWFISLFTGLVAGIGAVLLFYFIDPEPPEVSAPAIDVPAIDVWSEMLMIWEIVRPLAIALIPVVIIFVVGAIVGYITWRLGLWYPKNKASNRARTIDNEEWLFAMSYAQTAALGDNNTLEILRQISEQDELMPETAYECRLIVTRVVQESKPLDEAISEVAVVTESNQMRDMLSSLATRVQSGGDLQEFFQRRFDDSTEQVKEENEKMSGFYEMITQIQNILSIAPLFILVLALPGFVGQQVLMILVYLGIPFILGSVAAFVYASSKSIVPEHSPMSVDSTARSLGRRATVNDDSTDVTSPTARWLKFKEILMSDPLRWFVDEPNRVLLFSVPLVLVYYVAVFAVGILPLNMSLFDMAFNQPIVFAALAFVIPVQYLMLGPLAVSTYKRRKRNSSIIEQAVEYFIEARALNTAGKRTEVALEEASENMEGVFKIELQSMIQNNRLADDFDESLIHFANRIKEPRMTFAASLISLARKETTNIQETFTNIHNTLDTSLTLQRKRESKTAQPAAITVMTGLLASGILLLFSFMVYPPFQKIQSKMGDMSGAGAAGSLFSDAIAISTLFALSVHYALILVVSSTLMYGLIRYSDIRTGIKFGIPLSTLVLIAFMFAPV